MQRFDMNSLYGSSLYEDAQLDYFKEMYPIALRKMQSIVDEACDKMEYDNSLMYDEYPDKVMLKRKSLELVKEYGVDDQMTKDIMDVLFVNEIVRRRIRYRKIKGYC